MMSKRWLRYTKFSRFFSSGRVNVDFIANLRTILGDDKVNTKTPVLEAHGRDESHHKVSAPEAVVFANCTEDVVATVRACREAKVPIIPFGTGTSLEGHVSAVEGGISLDVRNMDQILEVNESDMDCLVQPGVTRKALNNELRHTGLFFPIDPGADASLGGMVATGASGTNAVRYGTMRHNVLGLKAVMANGEIIKTGGRARKSSAGYDLTRLLTGSEGTLGIITEIRLRLHGQPEAVSAAVVSFNDLESAVDTSVSLLQYGIPVARMEVLDSISMTAVNSYSKLSYKEQPTLFFEFHGSEASVEEQSQVAKEISQSYGGSDFEWSVHEEDRNALWQARHDAYYAALALRPGSRGWPTDVCVPISRLAECISQTANDINQTGIVAPIFGHVGDGNFHVILNVCEDDTEEYIQKTQDVNDRLIRRAIAMGGTCTGEHGVGIGKTKYLEQEHGEEAVRTMALIKKALDPEGLLNPGKIIHAKFM
ncbi:hypothetical protein AAMO2058_000152600 [Amorphochlora amoebiformis]